jgi:hypothetical protein
VLFAIKYIYSFNFFRRSALTTRKVIISDDLLVTLLNLVTEWYVFNDEVLSFIISYERRRFGSKNNDENEENVTES